MTQHLAALYSTVLFIHNVGDMTETSKEGHLPQIILGVLGKEEVYTKHEPQP
jgi:hypothetical protein